MTEMGMLNNSQFSICFALDKTSMFSVGKSGKVKPLHLIWAKYPHLWGKHNTIHVDDLERNFVLNKSSGIVIRPFNRPEKQRPTSSDAKALIEGVDESHMDLLVLSRYTAFQCVMVIVLYKLCYVACVID
jgi:hypothetical protein